MNILLTGGAGYIGSHTAVVLAQAGHEVVVLDNFCNSDKAIFDGIEKIIGKPLNCVTGDLRDCILIQNTLKNFEIDAVIHFAALKAVGESVQNPLEYYENNVQGTISLLMAMQACKLKTIVFSSSATVYGEPKFLPIDENHPICPTNPYGNTKAQIEIILQDLAKSDPEWRVICLRYFNPAGAHQSGLIGERPKGIPNNLMPYIAKVAVGELKALNVYGNDYPTPDGTGVRDYIHVMDLAEGHMSAIHYLMRQSSACLTLNLGTGSGYSVFELIKFYERACKREIPYVIKGRRNGDIASCYANVDKAHSVLGWTAKRTLEEMCEDSWRWQSSPMISSFG